MALGALSVLQREPKVAGLLSFISIATSVMVVFLRTAASQIAIHSDVYVYQKDYIRAGLEGVPATVVQTPKDVGFVLLMGLTSSMGIQFVTFWALLAVTISLILVAATRLASDLPRAAFVMALLPLYFPFANSTTNILRQGLAASVVGLILVASTQQRKLRRWGPLGVVAVMLHWSAVLPVAAILAAKMLPHRRAVLLAWLVTAVMFLLGWTSTLLGPLTVLFEPASNYVTEVGYLNAGSSGSRLDFFAFTAFLVFAVLFLERRYKSGYTQPVTAFIAIAATFNLFGFVAFGDRVAVYAWLAFPVVVAGVTFPQLLDRTGTSDIARGSLRSRGGRR